MKGEETLPRSRQGQGGGPNGSRASSPRPKRGQDARAPFPTPWVRFSRKEPLAAVTTTRIGETADRPLRGRPVCRLLTQAGAESGLRLFPSAAAAAGPV